MRTASNGSGHPPTPGVDGRAGRATDHRQRGLDRPVGLPAVGDVGDQQREAAVGGLPPRPHLLHQPRAAAVRFATTRICVGSIGQPPFGRLPRRILARRCRFRARPFVSWATIPTKEDAMKYMLLIHQGTTPTPRPEAWDDAVARRSSRRSTPATRRSTRRPASRPASSMQPPETATTVRVQDGRTLTTDGPFVEIKEALGGYLLPRGRRPRRGDRAGREDPGGAAWAARSRSARSWSGSASSSRSSASSGAASSLP